jgi:hypothetical protein
VYWLAVVLAGSSLVASAAVQVLVWLFWRSSQRMEQSGQERLEILREGMARLEFMTEERRGLQKELEWRRSMMGWEGRPLELETPLETNGHPESEQSRVEP